MKKKPTEYSPKVEACRADYKRLAECFVVMYKLELSRVPSLLD